MNYANDHIRNVLVAGHGGAGKTSLVEAMLYLTKATDRQGRVEDGNTVCDFDPEEAKRHVSLSLAVAPVEYAGVKLNLIDVPGLFDFEAGLYEGMDESYLTYRLGSIAYLGGRLDELGIPYQKPAGGHGIFLDAQKFYPQIPWYEFPGQVLSVELYKECGIRACDIGSYMMDPDPDTGEAVRSINEFTRLAIPRRVYTQSHFDLAVEAIHNVWQRREELQHGYRIVWGPNVLRHFQATLAPIDA